LKRITYEKVCEKKLPYLYKKYLKTDKKLASRVLKKEKEYLHILETGFVNSSVKRRDIEGRLTDFEWEKIFITKKSVYIRCQSPSFKRGKEIETEQCGNVALKNSLFCKMHNFKKSIKKEKVQKTLQEYKSFGLFTGQQFKAFQDELKELEDYPQEKFEELDDEIKLALALLRNLLKSSTSKQLQKKPWLLTGGNGILARLTELKKVQHDLKYSPKVVFTRDQVEYLFIKLKMAILEIIKDKEILQKLSDKFMEISLEVKAKWEV